MPLTRWNDDRLDDLSGAVRRNTERLDDLVDIKMALAAMREHLDNVERVADDALAKLDRMETSEARRVVEQAKERKADRRWLIATFLTTAGLVIAALAIFLG